MDKAKIFCGLCGGYMFSVKPENAELYEGGICSDCLEEFGLTYDDPAEASGEEQKSQFQI